MLSLPTAPGAVEAAQPKPEDPQLLQKMYTALQKALSAGDQEAVQQMQQGINQHIADKVRPKEATEGMGQGEQFAAGMGAGALKPVKAIESMVTGKQDPDYEDAAGVIEKTPNGEFGATVGENAAQGLVGFGAGKALGVAGKLAGLSKLRGVAKLLGNGTVRAGAEGATMGATSTTDSENRLERTVEGAAGGTAIHYGIGKLRQLYKGISGVTPEARNLRARGVDLTVGQSAPGTKLGAVEEASSSTGGFGPIVKGQRERAAQGWQDTVLSEAHAPNETVPPRGSGDIHQRLNEANEGFGRQYDAATAGQKMPSPNSMAGAQLHFKVLGPSVDDPAVMATAGERKMVRGWLKNQMSVVPYNDASVSALQTVRSNVRKEAMANMRAGNHKVAQLLHNANDALTEGIENNLPPDKAGLLKETDKAYRDYKTVEGTVARAKDAPEGFTPTMLQNEVAANTPKGAYARGGGNRLRELSAAGKATLDAKSPMTGVRALAHLPAVGPFGTAGVSALSNVGFVKRALLGETGPQRFGQRAEEALKSRLSKAARERLKGALQLGSGYAGSKLAQED